MKPDPRMQRLYAVQITVEKARYRTATVRETVLLKARGNSWAAGPATGTLGASSTFGFDKYW